MGKNAGHVNWTMTILHYTSPRIYTGRHDMLFKLFIVADVSKKYREKKKQNPLNLISRYGKPLHLLSAVQ